MVTSKRGRLSSADKEKIHALSERGLSTLDIALEVERREDVIEAILAAKKAPARGRKPKTEAGEAAKTTSNGAVIAASGKTARGLLTHQLWVRPGFCIELSLPGDLSQAEAERLSIMIRALPFSYE